MVMTMATKTANVLARVEPEVKEEAESILNQLGIPASDVLSDIRNNIKEWTKLMFLYYKLAFNEY